MLLDSFQFAIFLPLVLCVYFLLSARELTLQSRNRDFTDLAQFTDSGAAGFRLPGPIAQHHDGFTLRTPRTKSNALRLTWCEA